MDIEKLPFSPRNIRKTTLQLATEFDHLYMKMGTPKIDEGWSESENVEACFEKVTKRGHEKVEEEEIPRECRTGYNLRAKRIKL